MKKTSLWQQLLPHFLIIVGFIVVSLIYTSPIMEGKKLFQNDMIQARGAAEELVKYQTETGKRAFWTNSMFGGMPAFMIAMDYPLSFTTHTGRLVVNLTPYPANMIFIYMLGAYLMFLMLGYHRWLGVLGAIGYAFASYSIINIEAGHTSKVIALGFAPPFIGAVVLAYRGKWLLGSALAGLFAGLQLYGNHVQITYYCVIALVLFVIVEFIRLLIKKENLKPFLLATVGLAIAGALAAGSHASRLWVSYAYTNQTNRGPSELTNNKQSTGGADRDYAFSWSYGVGETFTYIVPNFVGSGSGSGALLDADSKSGQIFQRNNIPINQLASLPFYWGNQPFTSGPAYLGVIVVFLFLFSLFMSKDPIKWWILGIFVLFTMIAWGKNFAALNYFLFDSAPLYNKFRAHTMIISLLQIFVVWGMVLGLQEFFKPDFDKKNALNALKISVGALGGLLLFFAVLGGATQDYKNAEKDKMFVDNVGKGNGAELANELMRAIRADRATMQSNDAWRSFVFLALAALVLWLGLAGTIAKEYVIAGLGFLILIDLWVIDRRYLNNDNFKKKSEYENIFEASDIDRKVLSDKDLHYRVFRYGDPFNDAITSFHHRSIGGYHGAKLRRYQDLIENQLAKNNRAVVNMLNVKYELGANQEGQEIAQVNEQALGNVWLVEEYQIVKNADAEIKAMDKFDPKKTAFIDQRFANQLNNLKIQPDKNAKIKLSSYSPDYLVYESEASSPQLAVFSEIYYVDSNKIYWQAYLDGKPVSHLRANFALRGMVIPAGKHKIEFKFEVPIYHQGEWISLICSILLFGGLAAAVYGQFKKVD
ncbi:MAG: YfhO family protein [Microscillaceae bacterium]|jgi:hypothetical protein|nr:YfhO family protein [Microscillaceae bacterium]